MRCDKSVFFEWSPDCLRDARQQLGVRITRGQDKGSTATVSVCDPCANMLNLHSGLRVENSIPVSQENE